MTYVKSEMIRVGPWRLYKQNGEVTDKNAFYDPAYAYDTANFREAAENIKNTLSSANIQSVRFMNPHEAWVKLYPTGRDCSVTATENGFVLTRNDTTTAGVCGEQMTRHLNYFIGTEKPEIYSEWLYSSTGGGFCFGYTGRQKHVFNGHPLAFYAPYTIFIVRTTSVTGDLIHIGMFTSNNNLTHDFYKHLDKTQTVSLMQYGLLFERK